MPANRPALVNGSFRMNARPRPGPRCGRRDAAVAALAVVVDLRAGGEEHVLVRSDIRGVAAGVVAQLQAVRLVAGDDRVRHDWSSLVVEPDAMAPVPGACYCALACTAPDRNHPARRAPVCCCVLVQALRAVASSRRRNRKLAALAQARYIAPRCARETFAMR